MTAVKDTPSNSSRTRSSVIKCLCNLLCPFICPALPNTGCGDPKHGWREVVNLNMFKAGQQCPEGFLFLNNRLGSVRERCIRPGKHLDCLSATFPTYNTEYSQVCGRVTAGHWQTLQAFAEYHLNPSRTIDDLYVDGVSITHGQSPRQHIWTFAAGINGDTSDYRGCPCNHGNYSGTIPPFIGQDYFCDSGRVTASDRTNYAANLLWNGQGCGQNSNCCTFNNQPWFYKQLPLLTSDDIELRDCVVGHWTSPIRGGEVALILVKIYVK